MSTDTILETTWDSLRHRIGAGWDPLQCQVLPSALVAFDAEKSNVSPDVQYEFVTISNEAEMQREIDASFNVSATLFGVGLDAAYKQLNTVTYSSLSITAILRCTITYSPALYRQTPKFSPVVENLLQNDLAAFRRRYGSHFVAGYVEQSRISAVTVYTTSSKEQLNEFRASIHAGKGFGAVDTASSVMFLASDKNISTSPKDIERIFNNFPSTRPKPLTAILHTYAFIAPQYEDLRNAQVIGPELQKSIILALKGQSECRLYNFIASKTLLSSFMDIGQTIVAIQPVNAQWKAVLADCNCRIEKAQNELIAWKMRHELLEYAIKNAKSNLYRDHAQSPGRTKTFNFGYTSESYHGLPDKIHHETVVCRVHGKINEEQERRATVYPNNALIIGFRITSHWDDGTNGSFKIVGGGVDCNNVDVCFWTQRNRGGHWSVDAWYVDAMLYRRG
ncbi:uncharacterized protein EAE97_009804 [Botrytis byssoidea]|uniref:MACPF domain-containing protein n=1 Tax=Botrytis byssoidea TaxID=139641 RepID=A0A9P5I1G9_9HELO|nr:uncharacterized protein EAE97_009804 [Botrytis byssoidea]KAF7928962.1 hypothetical protein EAE97_009804 [Botrytis byssoidea]